MTPEVFAQADQLAPSTYPTVTQSKYFTPAFNAAIFDGPVRIYFAQYQEAEALKIYFLMQEKMNANRGEMKTALKSKSTNVFIMLYPTGDVFSRSFETESESRESRVVGHPFGRDFVIGVNGQIQEGDYDLIFKRVANFALPSTKFLA